MASSTSRRSLGGGRVLGSGKSLLPALPPPSNSTSASPAPQRQSSHQRQTSYLSPSESSLSVRSAASTSPVSASIVGAEPQDLLSRVSLEQGDKNAAATASSRLVCPICNEDMVTLLQLNRHLDDVHQHLEEVEQDEVKTWFKTQMVKAKRFQPLAVLNQKLKGLDVFESNDSSTSLPTVSNGTPTVEAVRRDPDEVVTRSHWQRSSAFDSCADPTCGQRLGSTIGSVNCRKCGRLFCGEHTMYQMKLSRSAQHEPVRGFWCRVCETCYKSREGYNDHHGTTRDHTAAFASIREKRVDKSYLEVNRLEKRLTKLTQLLADPPGEAAPANGGIVWPFSGGPKAHLRQLEQSIIPWEEDAGIAKCPFCRQDFTSYTFRRHHCRLCGRVVCNDPRTDCSVEVGLNVATTANSASEKRPGEVSVDVRMCKDCRHTLFSKRDFEEELNHKPIDQRSYENLVQFERGIRLLLPKFQKLLVALQNPDNPPSPAQLSEATRVRKRMMDTFTKYDSTARRIRDLPTKHAAQDRLQKAVYMKAYQFLNLHMLPLKSLPKVLKHASPHTPSAQAPYLNGMKSLPPTPGSHGSPAPSTSALASIKLNDITADAGSTVTSSSAVSVMEAEEKELRDRLIVLEEQKFFVQEMIAAANRHRQFDEMAALAGNVEDLSKEIDQINGQLSQMDFAGAYAQDRVG